MPLSKLRDIYNEVLETGVDPYSGDDDLRLLIARQLELLGAGDAKAIHKERQRLYAELQKLLPTFQAALSENATPQDRKRADEALPEAHNIIHCLAKLEKERIATVKNWREIYKTTESIDRMRDRALRRDLQKGLLVRIDEALMWCSQLLYVLKDVVIEYNKAGKIADSGIIRAISDEYDRVFNLKESQTPKGH